MNAYPAMKMWNEPLILLLCKFLHNMLTGGWPLHKWRVHGKQVLSIFVFLSLSRYTMHAPPGGHHFFPVSHYHACPPPWGGPTSLPFCHWPPPLWGGQSWRLVLRPVPKHLLLRPVPRQVRVLSLPPFFLVPYPPQNGGECCHTKAPPTLGGPIMALIATASAEASASAFPPTLFFGALSPPKRGGVLPHKGPPHLWGGPVAWRVQCGMPLLPLPPPWMRGGQAYIWRMQRQNATDLFGRWTCATEKKGESHPHVV